MPCSTATDAAPARRARTGTSTKSACYLWRCPLLSETFIQREIAALRRHGLDLTVLADAPGDLDTLDPSTRALARGVEYLLPPRLAALPGALLAPLLKRPRALFQVLAAVYRTRCVADRDRRTDLRVAGKTLYLARRLRTLGIAHAYSPWGEANAFILKLAAGLAGIGRSVQFRAHELYQNGAVLAVAEKMAGARFVVSNCLFHLPRLRQHLPARGAPPLHVVYEGLDLARFPERVAEPGATGRRRILSVARLLDCKGLDVLLRACARLQQAGVGFDCRVIGGPDPRHQRDYPARLEALRAALGLGGNVAFLGDRPSPEVHAAYYRADVFALPVVTGADGTRDITPNALLEAMAAGLPVISSRQTAIPEIVEDGVSGLLIDPCAGARAPGRRPLGAAGAETLTREGSRAARIPQALDINPNMCGSCEEAPLAGYPSCADRALARADKRLVRQTNCSPRRTGSPGTAAPRRAAMLCCAFYNGD
jgi:glycosyltransferase involved in cell wall biosynthesis